MHKYIAYLKNGKTLELEGLTELDAFHKAGYEGSPVGVVDYFQEVKQEEGENK